VNVPIVRGAYDAIERMLAPRLEALVRTQQSRCASSADPARFRGFAALPMQDPEAAAAELDRCVRELGFCGALVNDHLQGHYLDEPRYDEVWAALEELSVPLYLHPGAPPADRWKVLNGRPDLYGATWSWAAEVGGHALRIIYGGVFDRHPGATLILGHMGEFLPFMRSRLDSRYHTLTPRPRCSGCLRPTSGPTW
jgi:2,3-dihydroxybenzoate decarboxylase